MNKTHRIHNFNDSAASYDIVAILQREIGNRLLDRLDFVKMAPSCVLDVGAATGYCARLLEKRYKGADIICLDIAENRLQLARKKTGWFHRQHFICGDMEALPLADASVDILFSNLTFQWTTSLTHTFAECFRVLKPGGLIMFSTFGPDTLKELRASWAAIDSDIHVNSFIDMHDVGDALLAARFSQPVVDRENITMTYKHVKQLLEDLKGLGASQVDAPKHKRHFVGKEKMQAMIKFYESHYHQDGCFPATYEVLYAHAWKPELHVMKVRNKINEPVYIPVGVVSR